MGCVPRRPVSSAACHIFASASRRGTARTYHSGADSVRYLFAGEPFESHGLLSQNRARWLEVASGRFASVDPLSGLRSDPATLQRYAYADLNPGAGTDPSGEETLVEVMSLPGLQGNLRDLNIKANLGAIARAVPLACAAMLAASYAAHEIAGAGIGGPCSGRFQNRLRIQLQKATLAGVTTNTYGIPLEAPDPGVSVNATQRALDLLYINASFLKWFPNSRMRSLRNAIVLLSMRLNSYPARGGIRGRVTTFEQEVFGEFRVDFDNLAGWNLRVQY